MGRLRRTTIGWISELSWRLPGWPVRLMSAFSLAERGSAIDMLAAAELTERSDLRRKYFLHALDEVRHASLFAGRVRALGAMKRAEAALEDAGALHQAGVVDRQTLFERFGEPDFLAFVYVAEADAVEQFQVYLDRQLPDTDTRAMLTNILKDEAFHVSYSRAELERRRKAGDGAGVDRAISALRWGRIKEGWLRFSHDIGGIFSTIWLTLLYFLLLLPFRLFARLEPGGWQSAPAEPRTRLAAARSPA